MTAISRRAASALMKLLKQSADPAAVAGEAMLYAKAGNGAENGEFYSRSGGGIVQKLTGIRAILPTGYVNQALLSWTSVSQVTIGSGFCRSSDDTFDIYLAADQVVDIAVSGANGLDTGAEAASTWYAVYLIGDSTLANPTAGILSANFTTPTLPAGYDKYRRIGCVRNNAGSNFIKFYQVWNDRSRRYWYDDDRANLQVLTSGSATATTTVDCSSRIPSSSQYGIFGFDFLVPTVGGGASDTATLGPDGGIAAGPTVLRPGNTSTASLLMNFELQTSTAQKIQYKVTDPDDVLNLFVLGFNDDLT